MFEKGENYMGTELGISTSRLPLRTHETCYTSDEDNLGHGGISGSGIGWTVRDSVRKILRRDG